MVFLLAVLHLFILPAASGGYNDKCYLSDEKRKTLRLLVQNISRTFDKFDVKYWLDYGKLVDCFKNRATMILNVNMKHYFPRLIDFA